MNDGLIPNRYAKALYKVANEKGDTAQVYAQMNLLNAAYEAQAGLKKAVNNPFLPLADKLQLLCTAAGADGNGSTARFMELVVKNNRVDFMRDIALAFMRLYRENNGIARVEIVTATELGDNEINAIIDVVKNQLKGKTIELSKRVDPSLIGHFVNFYSFGKFFIVRDKAVRPHRIADNIPCFYRYDKRNTCQIYLCRHIKPDITRGFLIQWNILNFTGFPFCHIHIAVFGLLYPHIQHFCFERCHLFWNIFSYTIIKPDFFNAFRIAHTDRICLMPVFYIVNVIVLIKFKNIRKIFCSKVHSGQCLRL